VASDNELQQSNAPKNWIRGLYKVAGAISILGGAGVVVHSFLSRREKRLLKPQGRMIDVQGHRMHMLATGTGGPTVVLEAGESGYFGAWEWVQQELGDHTRVISYDRAGLGFSERARGKRDAASIARELDEMLIRAGELPPYILVGHSFGGFLVQKYAQMFPEKVVGLVLVDPSHADQSVRSSEMPKSMHNFRQFFHVAAVASHFGVMRVTDMLSSLTEGLSENERARGRVFFVSNRHLGTAARELDAWTETTEPIHGINLGNLPLTILSAGEPDAAWVQEFQVMHEEMLSVSTRSTHRILRGAEHLNIVTKRENARRVSRSILDMVYAVRSELND
jgi:pimeloyl-ACP methyl ester carboxylesterase